MSEKLINGRHHGSTIYFDISTRFVCTSLFEGATNLETICRKEECERFLKEHGYFVRLHWANNSMSYSKSFQHSYEEGYQTFSYWGVGVNSQKSMRKGSIKKTANTAIFLLHNTKWLGSSVIPTVLSPFYLKAAVYFHNTLDWDENSLSPIKLMSCMIDDLDSKYFHSWGRSLFFYHMNKSGVTMN